MAYDKRIGHIHDNRIEWPETDIRGGSYTKPATMAGVGGNRFIVLPFGYRDTDNALADLRAKYAPPGKSKRQLADETVETESAGEKS